MLLWSSGAVRYVIGSRGGRKVIVEVDPQLVAYYRKLMPRYLDSFPQMYPPHISVVRKEIPPDLTLWGRREGEVVEFAYSNEVLQSELYYWLNAHCVAAEGIREELGLSVVERFRPPPPGFRLTFHFTIGNKKREHERR